MYHRCSRAALIAAAVLLVALGWSSTASAYPEGLSIAINFGADEPDGARSDVTGPAGLLQTMNWNNLDLLSGGPAAVDADDDGALTSPTSVTVTWASNNTWSSTGRGEENNTAPPGGDRNLMTGFLDTTDVSTTTVTVSGLDTLMDLGQTYGVYVYVNGGVTGRGGTYSVGGQEKTLVDSAAFDGTYVEGENFLAFDGLTSASFTLTATPTTTDLFRAPLNGIEIVEGGIVRRIVPLREIAQAVSPEECAPNGRGPLTVTVSKELKAAEDPGTAASIQETILGPLDASKIGGADSVSDIFDPYLRRWLLLGPYLQDTATVTTPANPGEATMRLDYLTDGAGVVEASVQPEAGDTVATDYAVAASTGLAVTGDDINPDGVPTWLAWEDGDDTINFIEIYGQVDSVMTYALAYVSVESAVAVAMCVASDDAVQVLVDGQEVWINNIARGSGAVRECQDRVPYPLGDSAGTLSAGVHTVLVKVFQGDGGHDFRFGFVDLATGEPAAGIRACATPAGDTCVDPVPIGVDVSIDTTLGELADGVAYTVDVIEGAFSFSGIAADKAIEGESGAALGCDTRVMNLSCLENEDGDVDAMWETHPFADTAGSISVLLGGVEVAVVAGDATSATIDEADFQDGYNLICVVNSSGLATCCRYVKGGLGIADLLAGGDGTGTADPAIIGISSDTGVLQTEFLNANVTNTGSNPQAVDPAVSPYIDAVFLLSARELPITSNTVDGPRFTFGATDFLTLGAPSYGHILKDATHDIDKGITDIWAGGRGDWLSCVGIHAAAGITLDLAKLREDHGDLLNLSCFAGADQCSTATVNLYVIFSDATTVLDSAAVPVDQTTNLGEAIDREIPEGAVYLTLAVGSADAAIGCDHGVFANALITVDEGPVGPRLVRGDADSSGIIDLSDGVRILNYLFTGGAALECEDAGDTDNNGSLEITDAIKIFGYLFLGNAAPVPPAPSAPTYAAADCGVDVDEGGVDALGCVTPAETCN